MALRASELASLIEGSQSQVATLQTISNSFKGGAKNTTVKKHVDNVLGHLVKNGFLVLKNKDTEIYQVTGKVDYLYEVLDFIASCENIDIFNQEDGPKSFQEELDI